MADVRFYHMERQALEDVLPVLLGKALAGGRRIVVRGADSAALERLNAHLWTHDPVSFLPHGSAKDAVEAALQPVWLTTGEDNPNGADVLILVHGAAAGDISAYGMVCEMLDGRDAAAVQAARGRWKIYKDGGHDVTYWQQSERGWDKKA